jgi:hypothetical protein
MDFAASHRQGRVVAQYGIRDLDYRLRPGVWQGAVISADKSVRPGLAVQVCSLADPGDRPSEYGCVRLATARGARLWARVDREHHGYGLLRASGAEALNILPPLAFSRVAAMAARAGSSSPARVWARTFAEMLCVSPASPLEGGRWFLSAGGAEEEDTIPHLTPERTETIANQPPLMDVSWDFGKDVHPIALRDPSPADSGRVTAWRKHARAGTLPPVLLYWVSGLCAYVVLDGHDRLLAASLEGVNVSALRLERLSPESGAPAPEARDAALKQAGMRSDSSAPHGALSPGRHNALVLDAVMPREIPGYTRAYRLPGGLPRWVAEVTRELSTRGISGNDLLQGLTL